MVGDKGDDGRTPDQQALAAACAYIELQITDGKLANRGTGYLIDRLLLATADHVVSNVPQGTIIKVTLGDGEYRGRVIARDAVNDAAVLALDRPSGCDPLRLGRGCASEEPFTSLGYPVTTNKSASPLSGRVESAIGDNLKGVPSIVLYSQQAAAGSGGLLQGLSGSPILIDGYCIGHLKTFVPDVAEAEKNRPYAQFGHLYVCPIEHVHKLVEDQITLHQRPLPIRDERQFPPLDTRAATWSALLRLDRVKQWGELFMDGPQTTGANRLVLLHGRKDQRVDLFVQRIEEHYAHEANGFVIKVPMLLAGATANSGPAWAIHMQKVLSRRFHKCTNLNESLRSVTAARPTLLMLLRTETPRVVLRELRGPIQKGLREFLSEVLPSVLEGVSRLTVVLPIEYEDTDRALLTAAERWAAQWSRKGSPVITLPELTFPTWDEVQSYVKRQRPSLSPKALVRLRALYQRLCENDAQFEPLATAIDDWLIELSVTKKP